MIWTVVLWLGMQGQAHICENITAHWVNGQLDSSVCKPPQEMKSVPHDWAPILNAEQWPTDDHGNLLDLCMYRDRWKPCGPIHATTGPIHTTTKPAPAEHVFEIRTKREDVEDCGCAGANCPIGDHCGCVTGDCVRVTRELFIDGKRVGVVKGLDQ